MKTDMHLWSRLAQFFLKWKKLLKKLETRFVFKFLSMMCPLQIIWKYTAQLGMSQTTLWCMQIAFWITNATNTHSVYILLIVLPLQQWLHERAFLMSYTNTACLVNCLLYCPSVFVHSQGKVYFHCESSTTELRFSYISVSTLFC
jgi:hypothetical protein